MVSLVAIGIVVLEMFLEVERQDSTCPNLDKPLLLPLKYMACHARTYETSGVDTIICRFVQ